MNISSFRWPRTTYMWVRQIHLWVGAWGALAAILYGTTGLMQNHRGGDHVWPQGKTTQVDSAELQIPTEAQASPEQLSLWLQQTQHLDVTSIRKGGPGGFGGGVHGGDNGDKPSGGETRGDAASRDNRNGEHRNGGERADGTPRGDGGSERPRGEGFGGGNAAQKWTFGGGTAANSWALSYTPGSDSAQLVHSHSSLMAALSRLHKGIGNGPFWSLLGDSFAICMILLGISGIWMWARGRSAKEMIASVFGVAVLVFAIVVGVQLFG